MRRRERASRSYPPAGAPGFQVRQHFVRNAGEVQALGTRIQHLPGTRPNKTVLTGPNEIWALLHARVPVAARLAGHTGEPRMLDGIAKRHGVGRIKRPGVFGDVGLDRLDHFGDRGGIVALAYWSRSRRDALILGSCSLKAQKRENSDYRGSAIGSFWLRLRRHSDCLFRR
ncbi:MAG TPA: hypothetical protein VE733_29755 [Streptosporangiaceae bacterium]|nr:hypothetical protein [Streptosporangiaceae bacterium]